MKIIEQVLRNFIDVPQNILEVTNHHIIEVDAFEPLNTSTNLVVGHVLTCVDHPNSDHLHLTTVDLGDRVEQIVCGAPNVAAGQYVVVAQVGSVLPGDFKIKATKVRGESSNGMICSLKELGIDDKHLPEDIRSGIFHFSSPKPVGSSGLEALYQDGFVMTLGLTPNRGDLLSHLGFALDVSAMTGLSVKEKIFKHQPSKLANPMEVSIETGGCGLYHAAYFSNIEIKPSPLWMQSALLASDIKPINNVVDISNYVLIEYGTPLHMFDAKKIASTKILVRDAKPNEIVKTLDEIDRTLEKDDVVITNGKQVIAIGGVMGSYDSMIDESTTEVVLEAAYFDPKRIQKTVKRLNLRSDSSLRFERGIDPKRVELGLNRAIELIVELSGATFHSGIAKVEQQLPSNPVITIEKNYIQHALGIDLDEKTLTSYFDRYRYTYTVKKDHYEIQAPSDRQDLLIKADLLEEIGRMYGLNNIPMHTLNNASKGQLSNKQKRLRALRHKLANMGLNEVITYSLIAPNDVHRYQNIGEPVSILMPLSEDKKTLRQSLVHGLLDTVSYNQARQIKDVAIFEIGHVFAKEVEETYLGVAMSNLWHKNSWNKSSFQLDFFTVKGILEALFEPLGITLTYQMDASIEAYHPYRQATISYQDKVIGRIAEVHPSEQKAKDIDQTFVFELNLTTLLDVPFELDYQMISRFPSISRDLAFVVSEDVPAFDIIALIKQTVKKQLTSVEIFDIYQGEHIEKGKKSIAIALEFNDATKTLESEDVDQFMKKIINRLSFTYQAEIRK